MKLTEALETLESLGTEQTRKIYRKHAFYTTIETYGVSSADLQKLKKQIKTDHALAEQLWETGNLDAQVLATMIADPKQTTPNQLEQWVKTINMHMVCDLFVRNLVVKTPHARSKIASWTVSKDEFIAQAGWDLVALLATQQSELSDSELESKLEQIEAGVVKAKNRTRYAMLGALIGIGSSNTKLRKLAEAAAKRIGPVEIDHGETGCKTPEPVSYIAKMWERKSARADHVLTGLR